MKARFHLPDFTFNFNVNYLFVQMLEALPDYFYDDVEIASIYDCFPPAIWNGGRIRNGRCDTDFIKTALNAFNSKGIPLRFTFTNLLLKEEDLKDEFCNTIMKLADNGLNEVIVASPLLENYIRSEYPNYKITSSICKRMNDPALAAAELEKDYHIVVLDYDFNNRFDILEKLPHKEKAELLVCTACRPECEIRSEHFRLVSARHLALSEHLRRSPQNNEDNFNFFDFPEYSEYFNSTADSCKCYDRSIFQVKHLPHFISPEAIREKYMPMGYNQFKLDGRNLKMLNIIEQYLYYMAKPESRDEARFRFLCQLANQGLIRLPY